jgi:hypothetical protein
MLFSQGYLFIKWDVPVATLMNSGICRVKRSKLIQGKIRDLGKNDGSSWWGSSTSSLYKFLNSLVWFDEKI